MSSVSKTRIKKVIAVDIADADDFLAVEEPMEIKLLYGQQNNRTEKSISVTMRTPGNDEELATGFLFSEAIISAATDVVSVIHPKVDNENVVLVSLSEHVTPAMHKLEHHFYTTSSCGVCGKASIQAVRIAVNIPDTFDNIRVQPALVYELPGLLRKQQQVFENTGGLHASALFDTTGKLLFIREDVGRHNALDKLIGAALNGGHLPLDNHILLLSGRASFELIQKAVMAGIKIVAAVGAPSSLAAEMAEEWGITLIGFLRDGRFNIYSGAERIVFL